MSYDPSPRLTHDIMPEVATLVELELPQAISYYVKTITIKQYGNKQAKVTMTISSPFYS